MSDQMRSGLDLQQVLDELRKPFHPSRVTWKPGVVKAGQGASRALALAYADLRAYMDRLDEVCGFDWAVSYEPWGVDRIICRLTIAGVTRSSTGESTNESERSEIGGTVAEAQAFKRAGAMFGLGRYLYALPSVWADYDPQTKQFTESAKNRLANVLAQHYRRATENHVDMTEVAEPFDDQGSQNGQQNGAGPVDQASEGGAKPKESRKGKSVAAAQDVQALLERFNALGQDIYGAQWAEVCRRNVHRISSGKTEESGDLAPEQIQKLISGMMKVKDKRQPVAADN